MSAGSGLMPVFLGIIIFMVAGAVFFITRAFFGRKRPGEDVPREDDDRLL